MAASTGTTQAGLFLARRRPSCLCLLRKLGALCAALRSWPSERVAGRAAPEPPFAAAVAGHTASEARTALISAEHATIETRTAGSPTALAPVALGLELFASGLALYASGLALVVSGSPAPLRVATKPRAGAASGSLAALAY